MTTVAQIADEQARKLIDELPPSDTATRERRVEAMGEMVAAGITFYLLNRFVETGVDNGWEARQQERMKLLEYTNYHDDRPEETKQRFIEEHVLHWEAFAQHYIALCIPEWREWAREIE
jgi:hypothetical protein